MENFFESLGVLAAVALLLYLILARLDNQSRKTNDLRQLVKHDISDFEKFWNTHKHLSYEQALRAYYKDPKKLSEAIEEKNKSDELHRKIEEKFKKENTIKRVYAYKYEDFLFSLFSPFAECCPIHKKWDVSSFDVLPESYIIYRMRQIDSEDTYGLYCEFLKNYLLQKDHDTTNVRLGSTLGVYANILSDEDMNMDKWIRKNGKSQSKEELIEDVEAYMASL